jgi:hypothetical protein
MVAPALVLAYVSSTQVSACLGWTEACSVDIVQDLVST